MPRYCVRKAANGRPVWNVVDSLNGNEVVAGPYYRDDLAGAMADHLEAHRRPAPAGARGEYRGQP